MKILALIVFVTLTITSSFAQDEGTIKTGVICFGTPFSPNVARTVSVGESGSNSSWRKCNETARLINLMSNDQITFNASCAKATEKVCSDYRYQLRTKVILAN